MTLMILALNQYARTHVHNQVPCDYSVVFVAGSVEPIDADSEMKVAVNVTQVGP
jgi:hypothetical protein